MQLLTQLYDVAPRGLLGYLGKRRFRGGREEIPSGQIVVGVRTGAVKPLEILAAEHNGQPTEATATMTMEVERRDRFLKFFEGVFGTEYRKPPKYNCYGFACYVSGVSNRFCIGDPSRLGVRYAELGSEPTESGVPYLLENGWRERPHALLFADDGQTTVSPLGYRGPFVAAPSREGMKFYSTTTILRPV